MMIYLDFSEMLWNVYVDDGKITVYCPVDVCLRDVSLEIRLVRFLRPLHSKYLRPMCCVIPADLFLGLGSLVLLADHGR